MKRKIHRFRPVPPLKRYPPDPPDLVDVKRIAVETMAVFDRLPPDIRARLNYGHLGSVLTSWTGRLWLAHGERAVIEILDAKDRLVEEQGTFNTQHWSCRVRAPRYGVDVTLKS